MKAAAILRLAVLVGSSAATSGCDLLLGVPNLGDPANVATVKARFKAIVQSELRDPLPLDWGPDDRRIRLHYMGPGGVALCGRPANARPAENAYQINFFRGSFGNIIDIEVDTPAHPSTARSTGFCEPGQADGDGAPDR